MKVKCITINGESAIISADGFDVLLEQAKRIEKLGRVAAAASAALHYMRLHNYADQAWADDLEAAIAAAMTPNIITSNY